MSRKEQIDAHREARLAFVNRHKHQIVGLVMDAMVNPRAGSILANWTREMMKRVDDDLGKLYDELIPPPDLAEQPKPQVRIAK